MNGTSVKNADFNAKVGQLCQVSTAGLGSKKGGLILPVMLIPMFGSSRRQRTMSEGGSSSGIFNPGRIRTLSGSTQELAAT